jgi:ribonucleoside-diphosphate reductase alpha chain
LSDFRNALGAQVFDHKYKHDGCETWPQLADTLVEHVCGDRLDEKLKRYLKDAITSFKFIPGGRYLYYAGRPLAYFNNCYLLRCEEDTREDWANLAYKSTSCLMTGGGIGSDYSVYRASGTPLSRTGGIASGPLPAMEMVNEIGRRVMQGGSRRSAIYASLNWQHGDIMKFLVSKNWDEMKIPGDGTIASAKLRDFNFPAPLDHTNISVNYDDAWLSTPDRWRHPVFMKNVEQALRTAEPGFSFNFGAKQNETLRNACTEVTSEDDSDVCNLGSLNMARIETLKEFRDLTDAATAFLLCGTFVADLPYEKVREVREKNRRLGLGLMGMHEWLLQRGYRYEVTEEMHEWLNVWSNVSDNAADKWSTTFNCAYPAGRRAIAPTGSIGILAGTTTGIEPIFAVAYKRRFLKDQRWHVMHVIDGTARAIMESTGIDPSKVESAVDLAADPERRMKFQADVQDYVDQSISSTINLPAWGSDLNNACRVESFARMLSKYAPRLRGFTCYPDGARGGQPIVPVSYEEAVAQEGKVYEEQGTDICDITGKGGTCGG